MIFVDSNVFVLALRYPRDVNADVNTRFLETLRSRGDGVTSVVNLLEICGILSFNLNRTQLLSLFAHFARRFTVTVVPTGEPLRVVEATATEVLSYMSRRMSFGDALVAHAVDTWARDAEAFVSWDARHFQGKVISTAMTPEDFLAQEYAP
jgi:predicted nucleic acid-binding protein